MTAGTMNYASIVLVLVLAFSAILWVYGRKFYTGPVVETQVAQTDSEEIGDGSVSGSEVPEEAHRPVDVTA